MLIEIHMLKNYASSDLNRDDTGSPKSCVFGNVMRGRISSQCLKRSWRTSELFKKEMEGNIGIRTRRMPELVTAELKKRDVAEEYLQSAEKKLSGFANKDGKENKEGNWTNQVVIYSSDDIKAIADVVEQKINESGNIKGFEKITAKEIEASLKNAKTRPISLDIALFGRMVTSDAFSNVEASMQVAHAFSTNKVVMETDFFTAMDDLINGTDETGSSMMGDIDYNSSCYYLYASLDISKLKDNLKNSEDVEEIIKKAVPVILQTMVYMNPSGKQNSFAAHSLPAAVLVECKDFPVPVSYANAFVKPAKASADTDLITESENKLIEYVNKTDHAFELPVKKRFWFCSDETLKINNADICDTFPKLIKGVSDCLTV